MCIRKLLNWWNRKDIQIVELKKQNAHISKTLGTAIEKIAELTNICNDNNLVDPFGSKKFP